MKKGKEQGDKMDILMTIWTYFATNILQQPAFMIGLIVLIGYVLLGKPWYDTLSGTLKAIVGYLILTVGSGGLTNNFRPVLVGLKDRFQMDAMVIDPYFGQNAVTVGVEEVFGKGFGDAMILLFIAFIVNILLVRFTKQTKLRALFTTGNVQVQQAATAYWLIMFACPFLLENRVAMLIVMALLLGDYWAVGSNLTIKPCQEVTDGAGFCLAHQQMFGVAFFYWLAGKLFGNEGKNKDKKVKRIEDIELPGFMSMFNDNMVSASILMLIFFGAILCVLGRDYLIAGGFLQEGQSMVFYVIQTCLYFAVYLAILQLGVRIIQLAGYDVYYEEGNEQTKKLFFENLKKATEMAAKKGVLPGFETMETEFMNTVQKSMQYVNMVNSVYLNVYPDLGNITNAAKVYGKDVLDDIETGRGRLVAMHLKETVPGKFREIPFGTGHVDFEAGIKKAWELGVRRYVTEFWYTGNPEWEKDMDFAVSMMTKILDKQ